jgi:hypothetical protein
MCSDDESAPLPEKKWSILGIIIIIIIYVIFVFIVFALTSWIFTKMGFPDAPEQSFVAGTSAFLGAVIAIMLDRILRYLGLT